MKTKKITKKEKPVSETAIQMFNRMMDENEDVTATDLMVAFAKLKVSEALWETSKHFNNPDNVSYIKNNYSLDKIV